MTFAGHKHTPSAMAGNYEDILITLTAASKTFNLAGCQNAFAILPDPEFHRRYDAYTGRMQVQSGNPFGYIAVEAAYRGGAAWLEQAKEIIGGNYLYAKDAFAKEMPAIRISPLEGTYLMWVDFGEFLRPEEIKDFFQKKCRFAVDYGAWFKGNAGCHARFNLATSRANVEKAVTTIIENLKTEQER